MILEKSQMIEENMKTDNQHKNIDFAIIEELKRRRAEKRMTGEDLEMRREAIIHQV